MKAINCYEFLGILENLSEWERKELLFDKSVQDDIDYYYRWERQNFKYYSLETFKSHMCDVAYDLGYDLTITDKDNFECESYMDNYYEVTYCD